MSDSAIPDDVDGTLGRLKALEEQVATLTSRVYPGLLKPEVDESSAKDALIAAIVTLVFCGVMGCVFAALACFYPIPVQ